MLFKKTTKDDDDSQTEVYTDKKTVTFNINPNSTNNLPDSTINWPEYVIRQSDKFYEKISEEFIQFITCPLTCVSMKSAAITHHGHLFEHDTIEKYDL